MIKASEKRLATCHPLLRKLFPAFAAECNLHIPGNDQGFLSLEVCLAWRPKEVQEALFKSGRDAQGKVVDWNAWRSNAHWDESYHSFLPDGLCCAADTGIYDAATKKWSWPEPRARDDASAEQVAKAAEADRMWKTFAEIAPRFGLFSGYQWKRKDNSPLDPGHFQLHFGPWKPKTLREFLGDGIPRLIEGVLENFWIKANPEAAKTLATILLQK